jgi:hypothetical protein
MFHTTGAPAAERYLDQSKVGEWVDHPNASMASGARNVVDGLDWYVQRDAADGRPMKSLDESKVISLQAIDVMVRLDVVLNDGSALAGRVILWDGPNFKPVEAPVIACAFAHALTALYPERNFTTIGIWQARRQHHVEVPHSDALVQTAAAGAILAAM